MDKLHTYTINSIQPWRMLLFGVLGCLFPIVLFIISWNWWDEGFVARFPHFFDWMLLLTMILCAVFAYAGFKLSSMRLQVTIGDDGIKIRKKVKLPLVPADENFYAWNEVKTFKYTEDSKGKILSIFLHSGKRVTIAQAYVLDRSPHFDAFYETFSRYLSV